MKRGYVILAFLAGVIYCTGMFALHWSFPRLTLVVTGGVLACSALMSRG